MKRLEKTMVIVAIGLACVSSSHAQFSNGGSANDYTMGRVAIGTSSTSYGKLRISGEGENDGLAIYQNTGSTYRMYLKNNVGYITRAGSDTKGLAIDASGRIGIGETNPTANLHIAAGLSSNQPGIMIDQVNWPAIQINKTKTGWNGKARMGISGNGDGEGLRFTVLDGNTWKDALFMNVNGTVGIGTTVTKGHKLAVKGGVICEEIWVKPYGEWHYADFVFKDDYELRSLDEVERFIKDNGHLPEIPNEETVMEQGMNIHEMNVLLLQKVEELTLYVIEQNKKVAKVEEENKKMKNIINALQDEIKK